MRFFVLIALMGFSTACGALREKEPTYNEKMLQKQREEMALGIDPEADLTPQSSADPHYSSLWAKSAGNPYLVRNQKAQRIGDLLTILIEEQASASTTAKTDAKKESDLELNGTLGFGRDQAVTKGVITGSSDYKSELKGEGTTDRSGRFQATVQAVVENVLDNGTLFVRGRKTITINNEDQEVEISGFVRPDDIRINNTVVSSVMADAEIRYLGKGVVADKQRSGWGTRVLDWVWPF